MLHSRIPMKLTFIREMVTDGHGLLYLNSLFTQHLYLVFDLLDPVVQVLNHRRVLGVVLETFHLQSRCDERCFVSVQTDFFFFHHSYSLVIDFDLKKDMADIDVSM